MIKIDIKIGREMNVQKWKNYWSKSFKFFNVQIVKDTTQWVRFHVSYRFKTFVLNINLLGYEFALYI
jgi:hypothetical protein